jgi:Arc/MetJ family transcription regulator
MATNLALDDSLIERARKMGKHKTKKEAVTKALQEYIRYRQQQKVLDLMNQVDYEPAFNYKRERKRR